MSDTRNLLMKIDAAGGAIALAVLTGIAVIAVGPVITEREHARQRTVELASIQQETRVAMDAVRDASRRLVQQREEAASLPVQLRHRSELNARLAELVARAQADELDLLSILPGEAAGDDRYARTPINMSLRGDFASFVRYLHSLHQSSRDLELTNIEIRRTDQSAAVQAQIRAEWITLTD